MPREPAHQDITDAITDGPQASAMAPLDAADTTGVPIVEAEMTAGDRTAPEPLPPQDGDDGANDLDDILTEDLSVQGGE